MNTHLAPNRSIPRALAWIPIFLLALVVAAYAIAVVAEPAWRSPVVLDLLARQNIAALAHFSGGALALVCGSLQVNSRLRTRLPRAHRWLGRIYVAAVLVRGVAGLTMAGHSNAGPIARWGFGLLALSWLGSTGMGWIAVLRGDLPSHRRWMIRSFALTLAAVTLRLYLPASALLGIPFSVAYPAIAWLCWLPNLGIAQWLIHPPRRTGVTVTAA